MKRASKANQELDINSFEARYPNIAEWVMGGGRIEIGCNDWIDAFVLAVDEGGTAWEGEGTYKTIDKALEALDAGIKAWVDQH